MKFSKKLAIVTTILVSVAIGSGCAQRKPLPPTPKSVPPSTVTPAPRNVPPSSLRPLPRFHTANILPTDANRIASRLASKISHMKNVNSATVIVVGSTAYVGLDINANVEKTKTDAIKRDVINLVKKSERRITTVTVVSDPDSITRLKKVAQGVAAGKPISAFTRELAEIGRRIIPSVR